MNTQTQTDNGYIKTSSGYVRRLGKVEGEPRIYRIIRFRFNGNPRTIRNNVTLTEAQAHCEREDTSSHSTGNGAWFDGYDYMKGCKPRD
jgi:hypothetical protein